MENQEQNKVMTTTEWVVTLIITAIPLVGFIMLFVWAFGGNDNPNRANWAKAYLIIILAMLILMILFWSFIIGFFFNMADSFGGDSISL